MFWKIAPRAKSFFAGPCDKGRERSFGMHRTDPVLILSTFPEESLAAETIHLLLGEGLIACGSILPGLLSIYLWKGKIEESREVQVVLKTSAELRVRCMDRLAVLHPYEVPEIVAVDPSAVAGSYADWIRESLSPVP